MTTLPVIISATYLADAQSGTSFSQGILIGKLPVLIILAACCFSMVMKSPNDNDVSSVLKVMQRGWVCGVLTPQLLN